jgi:hypothetical protein
MDEFRVSDIVRSAAWIQTEYNNQKAPAAFYTVGIEETEGTGAEPFHNGWQYSKKITILASEVAADLTNFPVLIKTTDADWADTLNSGNVAQADGGDILFIAGDGTTKLDHEIERYDETTGELVAWVEVRSLSGSQDTDIYIFYGNSDAVDQWNPTGAGVWEPNYAGVWHLAESSGEALDSTFYYSNGTVSGTVTQGSSGGHIDGAYDFPTGGNGKVDFGDQSHHEFGTNSFTVSFWLNIDQATALQQLVFYKGASAAWDAGYNFDTTSSAATDIRFALTDNLGVQRLSPVADITQDEWTYLVGVVDRANKSGHILSAWWTEQTIGFASTKMILKWGPEQTSLVWAR